MRTSLLAVALLFGLVGCGDDDGGGGGDVDSGPGDVDSGPVGDVDSGPAGDVDSGPGGDVDSGPGGDLDGGPGPRVDAGMGSGAICGTRGAGPCAENEFCDWPEGAMCGRADAPGVCRPRPDVCAGVVMPVCGCDGMTYSNECVANSMGISAEYDGECTTGGGDCRTEGCPMPGDHCEQCFPGGPFICLPELTMC